MKQFTILFIALMFLAGCGSNAPEENIDNSQTTFPMQEEISQDIQVEEVEVVPEVKQPLSFISTAFNEGERIPTKYTCDGVNVSPELSIANANENAKSFALIVDDPDAPAGDWVHWLLWNIPTDMDVLEEGVKGVGVSGRNDFGKLTYGGPCPPSGVHRYQFKLYILDTELDLAAGSTKAQLLNAMEGHILEEKMLLGKYSR